LVLPLLLIVQGGMFWYYGLYRGVWRFASIPDLERLLKAVVTGVAVSAIIIFMFTRMEGIPRSVLPLYSILLLLVLGGSRVFYRWYKDGRFIGKNCRRVLVVGAGKAGEMLIRDLMRQVDQRFVPIAIVDDNAQKKGRQIHGVEVQGTSADIERLTDEYNIDLIVIAMSAASSKQIRAVVAHCESCKVPFRILPKVTDIMTGQATLNDLREVSIHDLLGRDPVRLDWQSIHNSLDGKVILVTGGGGSIGSELCRQIASLNPKTLIVLEHSEFNLYQIELEIRQQFPELSFVAILGSVADQVVVDRLLETYHPHVIYHAAAYKHVPMLESNVRQAVVNNIRGTRLIATQAAQFGVERFVLISTDKAVNPKNIMGCSKRIAELFCQNFNAQSETKFVTVRFGNVLGSAGSVVPLFKQQIQQGGPVTVTHEDMTRFFMTIAEACQLIMEAGSVSSGGEIFVLDMGESIKISYLAEQMILLSGKKPGEDIDIIYTGLRPGEKLFEELFHGEEDLQETNYSKLRLAVARDYDWPVLNTLLDDLVSTDQDLEIVEKMKAIVPEYTGEKLDILSKRQQIVE